ncbi:helix-turn-helix domain-containing protein [Streptomyces prunicolor]|nr:helix-turn-helix domain-containing protein [Streptomyces prunicolor]MCX5237597.1 helix-turn-helix domain-containing protein [Streptomyces prunicolor]
MSVVEQRYHAVMEVAAGASKTEVAARYGVSRQSVHAWVRRYEAGGLAGLADRSHQPTYIRQRSTEARHQALLEPEGQFQIVAGKMELLQRQRLVSLSERHADDV